MAALNNVSERNFSYCDRTSNRALRFQFNSSSSSFQIFFWNFCKPLMLKFMKRYRNSLVAGRKPKILHNKKSFLTQRLKCFFIIYKSTAKRARIWHTLSSYWIKTYRNIFMENGKILNHFTNRKYHSITLSDSFPNVIVMWFKFIENFKLRLKSKR